MAKRLTRDEKRAQAIIDLINEMLQIAGHNVTFEDIKNQENWFNQYEMTEEQRDEWKAWGKKYLMKKLGMYAARAEKEMSWIGLMWGLKTKTNEQIKSN
jgi:hypothetical protein